MPKTAAQTWTVEDMLAELRASESAKNRAGMARFGIDASNAFGVPLSVLRPLARKIGKSPELALELWNSGYHEARLMAIILIPPENLTPELATNWLEDIRSWDLCDQLCSVLSRRAGSEVLVPVFASDEREFIRRAGFALIAWRAVHAKAAPDSEFLGYLPLIRTYAADGRNYVWKAVHWALRQIGKRSGSLHGPALELAAELQASDDKAARRVGREAWKELSSDKVRARFGHPAIK